MKMLSRRLLMVALLAMPLSVAAAPPSAGTRVTLTTAAGPIVIELATKQAPITSANFLRYVDQKKLDGTDFYRASRTKREPTGFIQGGIHHVYTRMLVPIAHEPTTLTGLTHRTGTISMAREAPGSATGDFFITVGDMSYMDAHPKQKGDNQGYAAFGRVVRGMDVVRRILASRTSPGGSGAMKGQMIAKPVTIITARRGG